MYGSICLHWYRSNYIDLRVYTCIERLEFSYRIKYNRSNVDRMVKVEK